MEGSTAPWHHALLKAEQDEQRSPRTRRPFSGWTSEPPHFLDDVTIVSCLTDEVGSSSLVRLVKAGPSLPGVVPASQAETERLGKAGRPTR